MTNSTPCETNESNDTRSGLISARARRVAKEDVKGVVDER